MFTNTKIALVVSLILVAASAALANDSGENHQDEDRASGSVAGVNSSGDKSTNAASAYGYTAAPIHKQREQTESR